MNAKLEVIQAYVEVKLATLRRSAMERPSSQSFTPFNIAIIELEQVLSEIKRLKS